MRLREFATVGGVSSGAVSTVVAPSLTGSNRGVYGKTKPKKKKKKKTEASATKEIIKR